MKHDLSVETKQANLLKLLTHPVRIAILQILRQDEACVCHLEATLGYRQAYLSQQIAVLREGGLINDRKDGWNVYYHIVNPQVLKILDSMVYLLDESPGQLLITPKNCPCPKCNLNNKSDN